MKFLFIQSNADMYGSSRSLLRLTSRQVKNGNQVAAVLPHEGELKNALEKAVVKVEIQKSLAIIDRKSFRTVRGFLNLLIRIPISVSNLCSLIIQFRPDIVHSNTSVLITPGIAAKLLRTRHVLHVREFYSEFQAFWKLYRHYISFFSDRIICVSAGGAVEQIDDGITGMPVKPGEPDELAEALDQLLSNKELRRQMGKKGDRNIEANSE